MQQTKWQTLMQNSNTLPVQSGRISRVDGSRQYSQAADNLFPFRAPPGYLQKINRHDPGDPLLQQILPVTAETVERPGFTTDPLREDQQQPVPGLLHKYQDRALLIASDTCAIHCRYCFRRHFPYTGANASAGKWQKALDYLENTPSITEIILSGGDPLTLADRRLSELLDLLAAIPHLKRVRIHSRIPVVLPGRITGKLVDIMARRTLPVVMVVHANHVRELDDAVANAAYRMHKAGITLLNQSVLLHGVNDNVADLRALSERLFETHIMPYYLHMLDPVAGTGHFAVAEERARQLMQELRASLPGYLVPRLVREIAGEKSKLPVNF